MSDVDDLPDLPDECPMCGDDITPDAVIKTDSGELDEEIAQHRRARVVEEHMETEHPIAWKVGSALGFVYVKLRGAYNWVRR